MHGNVNANAQYLFVTYIYCVSPTCFGVHYSIIRRSVCFLLRVYGMEHSQTSGAQQAKLINNYKNAKYKLLKTNAAIWFDTICKVNKQLNTQK